MRGRDARQTLRRCAPGVCGLGDVLGSARERAGGARAAVSSAIPWPYLTARCNRRRDLETGTRLASTVEEAEGSRGARGVSTVCSAPPESTHRARTRSRRQPVARAVSGCGKGRFRRASAGARSGTHRPAAPAARAGSSSPVVRVDVAPSQVPRKPHTRTRMRTDWGAKKGQLQQAEQPARRATLTLSAWRTCAARLRRRDRPTWLSGRAQPPRGVSQG